MYRTLKIKSENLWFCSDMHFRHDRDFIWSRRGFANVNEQNNILVQRWNERCNMDSIVFHLGDFIFNDSSGEHFWEYVNNLKFNTLYITIGNHNSGQRQAYFQEVTNLVGEVDFEIYPLKVQKNGREIVFLPTYVDITVDNQWIVLCHYAIRNFINNSRGAIMLCGHSHGNDKGINQESKDRKVLDVGVENFGGPVSFQDIVKIMNNKKIEALDHHSGE